jgi:hypothetical protein
VLVENDRRTRELVEVRRADERVAVSPHMIPAERVSHDHYHVWTIHLFSPLALFAY